LALACATYSKRWKNVLSSCFAVGAICQVLTFVVMASDICEERENQDCTLSFGAGIIWCACSLHPSTICVLPALEAAVAHAVAAGGGGP
jgi:hypothetical protein